MHDLVLAILMNTYDLWHKSFCADYFSTSTNSLWRHLLMDYKNGVRWGRLN